MPTMPACWVGTMSKYRKYLLVWLILIVAAVLIDNHQVLGWQDLGQRIAEAFAIEQRIVYIDVFSLGEQPTTTTEINPNLKKGEKKWLTNYSFNGSPAVDVMVYQVEYDLFTKRALSYTPLTFKEAIIPMVPNTYVQGTKVALNAFFNPKFSRYGVNCKGCTGQKSGHGNFAVGIGADVNKGVRQFNGKYKKGLTFEGYYIVASDRAIPLCTVLRISNHNFKGDGLKPGVPFYAVVLDRGGAIKKNRLDFYIGDERFYNDIIKYSGRRKPLATIVAFGKRRSDKSGKRSCQLPDINSWGQHGTN